MEIVTLHKQKIMGLFTKKTLKSWIDEAAQREKYNAIEIADSVENEAVFSEDRLRVCGMGRMCVCAHQFLSDTIFKCPSLSCKLS